MSFKIRTTPPDRSDRRYYEDSPFYPTYGLLNCTAYAWGRFWEISGTRPKLSTGNAGQWFSKTSDGYKRGQTPRPGAVMCWSKPGKAGHVAIVEKVNSDGSVYTSESDCYERYNANPTIMQNQTRKGPNWASSSYVFQGFIYNPAVDYIDYGTRFAQEAEKHIGEDGTWSWSYSLLGIKDHWCAAFVVAVARSLGLMNKVIAQCYTADMKAEEYEKGGKGKVYKGPILGQVFSPKPGDLIIFNWNRSSSGEDHVGIVKSVADGKVTTIEGNTGGGAPLRSKVLSHEYSLSYGCIQKYYRPNWSLVGGYFEDGDYISEDSSISIGPLFDSESTRQDSIIREIGYIDSKSEPSISPSDIRLSAVNYTGLLSSIYESSLGQIFSGYNISEDTLQTSSGSANYSTDLSDLDTSAQVCIKHLVSKGLNVAAAVGISANIYHESSFRTDAVGDRGTSFGLCQWHNERGSKMKAYVGSNWATNMSGQLNFLWYELTTSYTYVLNPLKNVSNSLSGCREAASVFCKKFEVPANRDQVAVTRANTAEKFWNKIAFIVNNDSSVINV